MNQFQKDFLDYCLSGHALLSISTYEKDRAIQQISEVAKSENKNVFTWSIATGWVDENKNSVDEVDIQPEDAIKKIESNEKFAQDSVLILKDFGTYFKHETYNQYDVVISWIDYIKPLLSNAGNVLVFVGPGLVTPDILKHDITIIDFHLPNEKDIENQIKFVCEGVVDGKTGKSIEIDRSNIKPVIESCKGMTQQQVIDRVALAFRKHKSLSNGAVDTILREKASVIKSSGILSYVEPPKGGLDIVGGYDALKEHVKLDQPCFSKEAVEFGIDYPKGIMLVGIPGCGKTLLSLAIASEFKFPLISLDVGNLMNKYVGESEANIREAIKILESIAPCVLQLDEIEKGFGGSGEDGGASKRVFGTFLKWLNDRKSAIYAVATANEVHSLPPEFARKGRFDEIFGLNLPGGSEREQIFQIHLLKRNRDISAFRADQLSSTTEGFTGADIEQSVKLAFKLAFAKKTYVQQKHLMEAIDSVVPLSKTEPQRIEAIIKWCETRAKQANPQKVSEKIVENKRKVVV